MSSKLLEELPVTEHEPRIKKYRESYRKNAAMVKSLYGDRAFIAEDDHHGRQDGAGDFKGSMKAIMMLVLSKKKISQMLVKLKLDNSYVAVIRREYDLISAFYVPEDIKYVKLVCSGYVLGKYRGRFRDRSLEEIVTEAHTLPATHELTNLEYILWMSRQGKIGFTHNQEEFINIDGKVYRRLIFVQPVLPVCQCMYSKVEIISSDNRPIYAECLMCSQEIRRHYIENQTISWLEDEKDQCPLISFQDGVAVKLFTFPETKNDLLNARENLPERQDDGRLDVRDLLKPLPEFLQSEFLQQEKNDFFQELL